MKGSNFLKWKNSVQLLLMKVLRGEASSGVSLIDWPVYPRVRSMLPPDRRFSTSRSADLECDFCRLDRTGLRVVFAHVGLAVTENRLRVLQAELLTNGIGRRVAQLVRNPTFDASLLTSAGDRSAVRRAQDLEQRLIEIG